MTVSTSTKASGSSNTAARSRSRRQAGGAKSANLGHYLAAGLGASALGTIDCEAAVVSIDIGPSGFNIAGPNGGVDFGNSSIIPNFPIPSMNGNSDLRIEAIFDPADPEAFYTSVGIGSLNNLSFATRPNGLGPMIFGAGDTIGSGTNWQNSSPSGFRFAGYNFFAGSYPYPFVSHVEPDIVGPGSFMGFRASLSNQSPANEDFYYGYLEVTWNAATSTFQILSGAYEDQPNVAIVTVPEPGSVSLVGIAALALGAGAIRRSRKARRADSAAGDEESPRQG